MVNLFLIHPYMNFWKMSLSLIFMSFLMMNFSLNTFTSNLTMNMGCDILSFFMILLSIFIFSLSILSSKNIKNVNIFYFFLILFLLKMLILLFFFFYLFLFYIFFEFSLIPMMMLILGWGMKVERLQAGIYFLFYTMFSSLPFLYYLIYYMFFVCSNFMYMINIDINYLFSDMFFPFFFSFIFLVKMPIFLFHLWLPKAHVEASVSGSMILAGILLKLGGYGLMRIMMIIMEWMYKYSSFFISFSLWGGLIISLSCLNQLDLKMIVAFSSVTHMSMLIAGLYSMSKMGLYGSYLVMISHGLISSGLFLLVNIFYERTSSRSLMFNKGLINISPNLSLCSFLLISSGMGTPPSINLLSEFLLSYSLIFFFIYFMLILFFLLLLSVCYSMYMYSFSQHGKINSGMYFFNKIYVIEYFNMLMHWIPSNLIIMKSEYMILYF